MRVVYSTLWYLLTPFLLLRLWYKGLRLPAYRQRIGERFALTKATIPAVDIWLHAVSLGEVIAATPLITRLLHQHYRILVTTMTPTGSQRVQQQFGDQVLHSYIPYDLPHTMRRFFTHYQPKVGIIFETELWPNMLNWAHRQGVKLLLCNARLSAKSWQGYRRLQCFVQPMLQQLNHIYAQSSADAERFLSLGADKARLSVTGNIKFDLQCNLVKQEEWQRLKQQWGVLRPVVIFASTHDNEEQQILQQLKSLQAQIPTIMVLIAPRHPERFATIAQLAQQAGFNTAKRSQAQVVSTANEVLIVDVLGELLSAYHVSDIAFVGGSLVPVGGHNVLEAAALSVPVISGQYTHNFTAIIDTLAAAQAIELVDNAEALSQRIVDLYHDEKRCTQLVTNADQVLQANKGSIDRYVAAVIAAVTT